jgi:predicted anti-sigma-YlaC factor YlaD
MDCAAAQQVLSAAFDGESVDSAALCSAEEHYGECTQCAEFVAALERVREASAILIPADVLERALHRVRAEAAEGADGDSETAAQTPLVDDAPSRLPAMPAWAGWAAAAAAMLVVVGIATTQGVHYLLRPATTTSPQENSTFGGDRGSEHVTSSGTAQDEAATESLEAAVPASSPAPSYVVFDQEVYVLGGKEAVRPDGTPVGSLISALDTGDPPLEHPVYASDSPDVIVIAATEDEALRFTLVTRTVRGDVYSLRSGQIDAFGDWPTLPDAVPEPSSPDGLPVFAKAGKDDLDVSIFTRLGRSRSAGVAVAPGTGRDDPAAGSTGWTWWEPRR